MSLADPDTQHLAVLGLSTGSEKDALEGLIAGAARASSTGFAEDAGEGWGLHGGSAPRQLPTDHASPAVEGGSQPKRVRQTRALDTDVSKHEANSGGTAKPRTLRGRAPRSVVAAAASRHKNVSPAPPPSVAFQADKTCRDAEALPPLAELLHSKLLRPVNECLHITSLTRIQKLSWTPMVDRTRDVLVRSETGSGKTLAYALPLLQQLLCACDAQPLQRQVGTIVIVLCPTRELVVQVTEVLGVLTRCALFLTVGGIHGGENRHKEKARLRKGIPLLAATPGRLLDHLKATASFRVEELQTIVLDEADRLLDMGFEQAIKEIMGMLLERTENAARSRVVGSTGGQEKHSLKRVLVSATITAGVERLTHFALRSNVLRVGETEDTFSIPSSLRQHYALVPVKHRLSTLISFLRSQFDAGAQRILVFVSTADSAEFHYYLLSRLRSPFRGKRANGQGNTAAGQRAHRHRVRRQVEEANRHLQDHREDVVTFEDDSSSEEENAAGQALAESDALLDANIFKLHGNMPQVDRASVFKAFKQLDAAAQRSPRGVLFCTDVAARGLDMPRVDWIVHYDPPADPACYVHRIGRTARIGNAGDSLL
ncbi:putative ATP-dependent DEAD/H RNA helicase, partial [Trypanosoma conorhini]